MIIALSLCNTGFAQTDTLKISFKQAEKTFLDNNLSLIAQKYNISAAQALVQQAKLWDNPTLATDQNLYDNTHSFFNHSNGNGEVYAVISQIIKTAGKRGLNVQLAKDGVMIQQAQFSDLMRNLHYNLQLDFAQLANLNEQAKVYHYEISAGTTLVGKIEHAYKTDKTKYKDFVRLKALLFGLENDMVDNSRQINALETELKVLLQTKSTAFILPVVQNGSYAQVKLNVMDLIEKAKNNRADYLSARYVLANAQHNLKYQKALAIPDVTIGVDYDKVNSYAPNYFGLQVGFALPFFNRNQGNIRSAVYDIQSKENTFKENGLRLENAIVATLEQYRVSAELLATKHEDFNEQYDQLFESLLNDYQSGKIGLVDFVDFFDSYKDTKLKLLQQQYNLQKAIADLNFTVGTSVVNL
ncbi:TolC family protein [Pedobacter sp. HMWF019]|uniref:TolC family protein n=1 Tax=Pedobacter sp. HMWF019 TaxID=2056856 RepID=UPI001304D9E0|nr:TolC family protein [Pedobacter sp. HMWF019]